MRKKFSEQESKCKVPKEMIRSASVKVKLRYEEDLSKDLDDGKWTEHPTKIVKRYMRVRSQKKLWSDRVREAAIKPLDAQAVEEIKNLDFTMKFVDMGNACYIDEHFSDII